MLQGAVRFLMVRQQERFCVKPLLMGTDATETWCFAMVVSAAVVEGTVVVPTMIQDPQLVGKLL